MITLYYTNCSILLQGSPKEFPECGRITPAEYLAIEMEKAANDFNKKVDMVKICNQMKIDIEEYKAEEQKIRGKGPGPSKSSTKSPFIQLWNGQQGS